MTDNRYAKVFCIAPDGQAFGILDRMTGKVHVNKYKSTLDVLFNAITSGGMQHEDFHWSSDVEVLGELGPVPEPIEQDFTPLEMQDSDGDYITVEKAENTDVPGTYIVTSEDGVFLEADRVPTLLAGIARSAGLDPETLTLPTE